MTGLVWLNDPRFTYREVQGWLLTEVESVTLPSGCAVRRYVRRGDRRPVWTCDDHKIAATSETLEPGEGWAETWHALCLALIAGQPDVWGNRFALAEASVTRTEREKDAAQEAFNKAAARLAKAAKDHDKAVQRRTKVIREARDIGISPKVSGPECGTTYSAARRALERGADLIKEVDSGDGAPGAAGGS